MNLKWYLLILTVFFTTACQNLSSNLEKLKSNDAVERTEAIHWLYSNVKTETTYRLLKDALAKDSSELVRSLAARLMGMEKNQAFVPYLESAVNDSSYLVRMEAVQSLGYLKSAASIPLVGAMLERSKETKEEKEPNPWVRLKVLKSLDYIDNMDAVPYFIEALNDRDPAVRFQALLLAEKFTNEKAGIDKESWETWYKEQQKKKKT